MTETEKEVIQTLIRGLLFTASMLKKIIKGEKKA